MLVMMTTKTRMMTIRLHPLSSIFISMFTVHSLIHGTHQAPSRYYKNVSIPQNGLKSDNVSIQNTEYPEK